METLVTGEVVFDDADVAFSDATVYIKLKDVTYVDAASETVAEQVIHAVSFDKHDEKRLSFSILGELPNRTADYIVTVHVDLDGDGRLSEGDFLTTQSYPVLTHGYPSELLVRVVRI